jgi:hypothetical protein
MAKKPTAARGKTTRKGKIKKIMKQKISDVMKRQGKTLGPIAGAGIRGLMEKGPRKVPNPRGEGTRMETGPRKMPSPRGRGTRMDKGPRKMTPLAAGLTSAAARLAKRLKPSGRLNADDIKRVKQMMSKRKGK